MYDDRILIVDDEDDYREIIRRGLEANNYKVLEACNGDEALEIIKKEKIPVVLLDIMMPGISGLDLLSLIYQHSPKTLVIMATGYCGKEQIYQAYKNGVFDFLEKPMDIDLLHKRVSNAFVQHRLQKMIDLVVEHFLTENFKVDPNKFATMNDQEKSRILSQASALIQIKQNKRQVL